MSSRECPVCGCARAENELLRTELKVDALRYQWLKKHAEHTYGMWFFDGLSSSTGPTEFEAAVDHAMQMPEPPGEDTE